MVRGAWCSHTVGTQNVKALLSPECEPKADGRHAMLLTSTGLSLTLPKIHLASLKLPSGRIISVKLVWITITFDRIQRIFI